MCKYAIIYAGYFKCIFWQILIFIINYQSHITHACIDDTATSSGCHLPVGHDLVPTYIDDYAIVCKLG